MRYTIQIVAILLIALHAQAFQATPEFKHELSKVPLGRLASGREDALFALFLASDESVFFVGRRLPFAGAGPNRGEWFCTEKSAAQSLPMVLVSMAFA